MKIKNLILYGVVFFLTTNEVNAGSLFDVYFSNWSSGVVFTTAQSHTLVTIMPYADLIYVGQDSSKYLVHKQVDGKPFAVEKLGFGNESPSTRNLNNQYVGMLLWTLENTFSDLFWSYVNSSSVTVKTQFLSYTKQKNDSVFKDLSSGKLVFSTVDFENESAVYLIDAAKKDTMASFVVKASLLDLVGGDQNTYNAYLAELFENSKAIQINVDLQKNELLEPFRKGLIRIEDSKALNEVTKDEPFAKKIMQNWLNADFSQNSFETKSFVKLAIAGRDTLKIGKQENVAEFCNLIKNNFSAYGEIAAIGLLSTKIKSENQKQMRFILILKQEQLSYDHVLRIDHMVNKKNNQWILGDTEIIVMALNPPGKTNE